MWRIARLALVAAMLIAAYGTIGDSATGVSPRVISLARIDGWPLTGGAGAPTTRLVVAYDAAAAQKVWTRATRQAGHEEPPGGYGVHADLGSVDFTRQAVLVLESAGASSCPPAPADARRPATPPAPPVPPPPGPGGFCPP